MELHEYSRVCLPLADGWVKSAAFRPSSAIPFLEIQLSLVFARADANAQQMFTGHQTARLMRIVSNLMQ